ncbi:hypothetical protein Pmi06nite_16790 [Planotetraspora mira]|uniref:Uncharacterized protein n=1 Tax=Planotetraspora mira TaxID=58121 RepID=A0A8J3X505_9ACTN|nr:hypothetical protein Pmi06nite_16790 [Planotetraspora mira]
MPSAYSLTEIPVPPRILRFIECCLQQIVFGDTDTASATPPTAHQAWLNLGLSEPLIAEADT